MCQTFQTLWEGVSAKFPLSTHSAPSPDITSGRLCFHPIVQFSCHCFSELRRHTGPVPGLQHDQRGGDRVLVRSAPPAPCSLRSRRGQNRSGNRIRKATRSTHRGSTTAAKQTGAGFTSTRSSNNDATHHLLKRRKYTQLLTEVSFQVGYHLPRQWKVFYDPKNLKHHALNILSCVLLSCGIYGY